MSTKHDDHDDNGELGTSSHPYLNDPGSEDPGALVEQYPELFVHDDKPEVGVHEEESE